MKTVFDNLNITLDRQQDIFDMLARLPDNALFLPRTSLLEFIIDFCDLTSNEIEAMQAVLDDMLNDLIKVDGNLRLSCYINTVIVDYEKNIFGSFDTKDVLFNLKRLKMPDTCAN